MYGGPPPAGAYEQGYVGQQPMYDPSMGQAQMGMYDPQMGQPQQMYDPMMGQPQQMIGQPQQMMGQPQPMGMYDPQMAQAQAHEEGLAALKQASLAKDAEAELQALEDKKAEKDAQRKQKEIEHLAHTMRSGGRNQEDNESCSNLLCFWGILNGLLWAVPLLGDSWWNKIWHGTSINKLTVVIGLFNMYVNVECADTLSGDERLCHSMKKYSDHDGGHWAIKELQVEMCEEVPDKCHIMQRLVQAGYGPCVLLPAAAAFEVIAILLLYFYWHGKPSSLVRTLSSKCAALAPFAGIVGFISWLLWSPYMHELPRIWAEEGGSMDFANSSVFGMKETFTLPMGWCCMMAFLAMISSMLRFFVQFTMPFHIHEPDPHGINNDENAALLREAEKQMNAKA